MERTKEMTKLYAVGYTIKANNTQTHDVRFTEAQNAQEACKLVKASIYISTGRNAFQPFAKEISKQEQYYIDATSMSNEELLDRLEKENKKIGYGFWNDEIYEKIIWLGAKGYTVHHTDTKAGRKWTVRRMKPLIA